MGLYFDHKLSIDNAFMVTDLQWHPINPVLAVASCNAGERTGGIVNIFHDEGEKEMAFLQKSYPATAMCWHPVKRTLAVGWEKGDIALWNPQEVLQEIQATPHKSDIVLLCWSSSGQRLLSADSTGLVCIWKADTRGNLSQLVVAQHTLASPATQAVLRVVPQNQNSEFSMLARAAVSGDKNALDMFEWKAGTNGGTKSGPSSEAMSWIVGTEGGQILLISADPKEKPQTLTSISKGGVRRLLYKAEKQLAIALTDALMLCQVTLTHEGTVEECNSVKLSGKTDEPDMVWACGFSVAISTQEGLIRMFDIDQQSSYCLSLDPAMGYDKHDRITSVAFSSTKNTISAGTESGQIAFWKLDESLNGIPDVDRPEISWKLQQPSQLNGKVAMLSWSSRKKDYLAASIVSGAVILSEQQVCCHVADHTGVVQAGPSLLAIIMFGIHAGLKRQEQAITMLDSSAGGTTPLGGTAGGDVAALKADATMRHELKTDIHVKGTYVTRDHIAVWNGKQVVIYNFTQEANSMRTVGSFDAVTPTVCIYGQNVYTFEGQNRVKVQNFQGIVKQLITFSEASDGQPCIMAVNGHYLVVGTTLGAVKLFDLSRRDAKQVGTTKHVAQAMGGPVKFFGQFLELSVNCIGTRVSWTHSGGAGSSGRSSMSLSSNAQSASGQSHPTALFVWNTENDHVNWFNFGSGMSDQQGSLQELSTAAKQMSNDVSSRSIDKHCWDSVDPRLMAVQLKGLPSFIDPGAQVPALHIESDPNGPPQGSVVTSLRKSRAYNTMHGPNGPQNGSNATGSKNTPAVEPRMATLFSTPDSGIALQDSTVIDQRYSKLLSCEAPYIYYLRKMETFNSNLGQNEALRRDSMTGQLVVKPTINQRVVQGSNSAHKLDSFSGHDLASNEHGLDEETKGSNGHDTEPIGRETLANLGDLTATEHADEGDGDAGIGLASTLKAVLDFSYWTAVGNMDEAFRAIKLIKSESVWHSMAKMCVKTRRLDVAVVCLGHMKNARAARALRKAQKQYADDLDAQVAILALQLGCYEDAERLLNNAKRFDILARMHACRGKWSPATAVTEMHDQISRRTTYFRYAQASECLGDLDSAVDLYEKAGVDTNQVPRMLQNKPEELVNYATRSKDKAPKKWLGHWCEVTGDPENAQTWYEKAQDTASLVRLATVSDEVERAKQLCDETGDRYACVLLAQHYEQSGQTRPAVTYFAKARAYGNAIRVCLEHGLEDQLMNLAFMADADSQLAVAQHLEGREGKEYAEKAVLLYHKAGRVTKATQLAFETKQFQALQYISGDIDDSGDPELLRQCAEFFLAHKQWDRAVDMLAKSKQWPEAMVLVKRYGVPLKEGLINKLTPPQDHPDYKSTLATLAEVCADQREYHLAAMAFNSAGDRIQAMKALAMSGDAAKIMVFASVARQKEIFILAANALQHCDWRNDPEVWKSIKLYYIKGGRPDLLANFFASCADVEIDEHQDYEKAFSALTEASKTIETSLAKASGQSAGALQAKQDELQTRIALIKKFANIRRNFASQPAEASKQAEQMLGVPDIQEAVRPSHILALLLTYDVAQQNWTGAKPKLAKFLKCIPKGIAVASLLPPAALKSLASQFNAPQLLNHTGSESPQNKRKNSGSKNRAGIKPAQHELPVPTAVNGLNNGGGSEGASEDEEITNDDEITGEVVDEQIDSLID